MLTRLAELSNSLAHRIVIDCAWLGVFMDVVPNTGDRLCFGLFEADLAARKLYRRGVLIHIQDKPFQILALLLAKPGEVVTREELQKALWPRDTFVDFDEGLNTAIRKLRYALGDSRDNPTFIETVPRQGYRLLAPVRVRPETPDQQDTTSELVAFNHTAAERLRGPDQELRLREPGGSILVGKAPEVRMHLVWSLVVIIALGIGFGVGYSRRTARSQSSMHLFVQLPHAVRDLALSHDGRIIAFVAPLPQQGGAALWTLEVGASGTQQLQNTESASYPFWSPDDQFIAFFADGKLKKVGRTGGPVHVICDAPIGRGGTWNQQGVIVFAGDSGVGMRQVSAAGGRVTMVPGFEQKVATTMSNRWPVFLPDGKHFLYTSIDFGADLRSEANAIYVASLDSGEHHRLVTSNANAAYVPGYVLFSRNGTLMAQRFDPDQLQLIGENFAVANEVEYLSSIARALFSVSANGTLVYQNGLGSTFSQLQWFGREGKRLATVGIPARYANPRLSPDNNRVAVDIDDPEGSNTDIWVIGPNHRAPLRLSFNLSQDEAPLWSHDGRQILWLSDRDGRNGFYIKDSDGTTIKEVSLMPLGVDLSFASAPSDWSPDGHFLLYTDLQETNALHLWVFPMIGDRKPYRFLLGPAADLEGQFSPDGNWVAYSSNESGRWEVYVASFPGSYAKYQVSTAGGQQPRWRRDGRELFFIAPDRNLMASSVKPGATLQFNRPVSLFQTSSHEPITAEEFFTYDVSADGERFLVNVDAEQPGPHTVDIVFNWVSMLKH